MTDKDIPKEHTPLLNAMLDELKEQGFNSLRELFTASRQMNVLELGFDSIEGFETRATEAEKAALEGMWQ